MEKGEGFGERRGDMMWTRGTSSIVCWGKAVASSDF
jgi:hypothetical protein